jgi:hypothetical protein
LCQSPTFERKHVTFVLLSQIYFTWHNWTKFLKKESIDKRKKGKQKEKERRKETDRRKFSLLLS